MSDYSEVLSKMSLEEKASLLSGATFWTTKKNEKHNIPSVVMTDGPHGLRKELGVDSGKGGVNIMQGSVPATCFPTAVTTASTWDPELLERMGKAIGEEALDQGISTVLGPGTNIKRSPLCGRNFEYFSEDPFLVGEMSTAYVKGVQQNGVGCSLKHFCGNNQEYYRMSIDSKIDERALREIYLPSFENTVKRAQPWQIMCSYNKLNGTYLSDNKRMLTDILRKEWHFDGIVVSDWGAVNNRIEGVKAGLDLQMPTDKGMSDKKIVQAVQNGTLDEAEVDACAERMLDYIYKGFNNKKRYSADYESHHALCREIGAKGAVLLKNEGKLLPLVEKDSFCVIGKLAEESRYQGAGSSRIVCKNLVSFVDALKKEGKKFKYAPGYTLKGDGSDKKLLAEAVQIAKTTKKVILVIGLTDIYESEGFDRTHMDLPKGHNDLVESILKVNKNVIVLLQGGSPVSMPWKDEIPTILNVYLQGEAVGESMCDLVFGKVCPGGKLAETYPVSLSDVLAQKFFPMGPKTVEYRESIFVGYRYFDTAKKEVAFPFGYGLSYTTFKIKNIKCLSSFVIDQPFTIEFDIVNTGRREGSEVVQIYVGQKNSPVFKAEKELKGFQRVYLKVNETKHVSIPLNNRSFAFYNTATDDWSILSGKYEIKLGVSSRDILFTQEVKVDAPEVQLPSYGEEIKNTYGKIDTVQEITKEQFELLYGEKLPDNIPYQIGEFHENCTLSDLSCTRVGKLICNVAKIIGRLVAKDAANSAMVVNTITSLPLRALSGFSGGILSMYSVYGMVDLFNKKKGGWKKLFNGFKKQYK